MEITTKLFGFSKKEVKEKIEDFQKTITALEQRNKENEDIIRELKSNIRNLQEREQFIGDVMLEAKTFSKNIITESQQVADERAQAILQDAEARLRKAEDSLQAVSELEKIVESYEIIIKEQLIGVLDHYIEKVNQLNLNQISDMQKELRDALPNAQEEVALARSIVKFPVQENGTDVKGGDMPVFVMN